MSGVVGFFWLWLHMTNITIFSYKNTCPGKRVDISRKEKSKLTKPFILFLIIADALFDKEGGRVA